jgi:hypothetical protein
MFMAVVACEFPWSYFRLLASDWLLTDRNSNWVSPEFEQRFAQFSDMNTLNFS